MVSKKEYVLIKFKNLKELAETDTGLIVIHGEEYDKVIQEIFKVKNIFYRQVIIAKVVDEKKYMIARIKHNNIFI